MADQSTPNNESNAPDTARTYERAKPEAESGAGRLDNNKATPTDDPDRPEEAVSNRHPPRQLNAEDLPAGSRKNPDEPDHSMLEEEPTDPDFAPTEHQEKRNRRHPRTEGRGGTP